MTVENNDSKKKLNTHTPSKEEAMSAVATLIRWAGDNPDRDGLKDTPKRYVRAFEEYFSGYKMDDEKELSKTFEDIKGYTQPVIIKRIPFESHCEHHIAPFIGTANIAYIPNVKVCGLSKIARVVDVFAKRLQNQENLTKEIAMSMSKNLEAKGVAVAIDAVHHCMCFRGVKKHGTTTFTTHFTGLYEDFNLQNQFLKIISIDK